MHRPPYVGCFPCPFRYQHRRMARINDHYLKLKAGYLFPEIGRRVKAFAAANPATGARVIRMGIGDVTEPLPPAVIDAMHKAVDEMANRETFRGYPPEQGYDFLRQAIATNDFQSRNCDIASVDPSPENLLRSAWETSSASGDSSSSSFRVPLLLRSIAG